MTAARPVREMLELLRAPGPVPEVLRAVRPTSFRADPEALCRESAVGATVPPPELLQARARLDPVERKTAPRVEQQVVARRQAAAPRAQTAAPRAQTAAPRVRRQTAARAASLRVAAAQAALPAKPLLARAVTDAPARADGRVASCAKACQSRACDSLHVRVICSGVARASTVPRDAQSLAQILVVGGVGFSLCAEPATGPPQWLIFVSGRSTSHQLWRLPKQRGRQW